MLSRSGMIMCSFSQRESCQQFIEHVEVFFVETNKLRKFLFLVYLEISVMQG